MHRRLGNTEQEGIDIRIDLPMSGQGREGNGGSFPFRQARRDGREQGWIDRSGSGRGGGKIARCSHLQPNFPQPPRSFSATGPQMASPAKEEFPTGKTILVALLGSVRGRWSSEFPNPVLSHLVSDSASGSVSVSVPSEIAPGNSEADVLLGFLQLQSYQFVLGQASQAIREGEEMTASTS